MADGTTTDIASANGYTAEIVRITRELTASINHYTALHHLAGEHGGDVLQDARSTACRSWRGIVETIPGDPPAFFAGTHAVLVRWAAALADAGDAMAAAIDGNDPAALAVAIDTYRETIALSEEFRRVAEAEPDGGGGRAGWRRPLCAGGREGSQKRL